MRQKSLLKEDIPNNVIGEIAEYLHKHCGIPGCSAIFHLHEAEAIINIIIEYNKKLKENKE